MGQAKTMKCPECGYEHTSVTGIGYLFPVDYAETVKKAKKGKLGRELRDFFAAHEDGAINAEHVDLCCEACGELSQGMDLTMYLPKAAGMTGDGQGPDAHRASREITSYVMPSDLQENYTVFAKYPHKCGKCGGKMRIVAPDEDLLCPACRIPLEATEKMFRD